MKKFLYIAIIGGLIWSCGGSDDPPPPEPPKNSAPTVPVQVYPADKELCIDNSVNFQWNASTDPDGDSVYYTVEVSKNSNFSPTDHKIENVSSTSTTIAIEEGTVFYWRVKATDKKDDSSFSSNNQFYTEGEGIVNHLPFSPDLVAPELDATISESSVTLKWTASDVDSDPLTYDVYFGTDDPPTVALSPDQSETSIIKNVDPSTNYYWKVVVKDNKGGETIGQVWKFKTD